MLNRPVDKETAIFKRDWFSYREYGELEFQKTRNWLTIDSKGTDKEAEQQKHCHAHADRL